MEITHLNHDDEQITRIFDFSQAHILASVTNVGISFKGYLLRSPVELHIGWSSMQQPYIEKATTLSSISYNINFGYTL